VTAGLLKGASSAAAILAPALVLVASAGAASSTCDGITAKVRNSKVVRGGARDDILIGGARSQTIIGGPGDDRICAGGGNDVVHGGHGSDTMHGAGRGDTLFGESGSDRLYGDILDDKLFGGSRADALIGGHGVDKMSGGSGNDLLRGGVNRDCYDGGGGANAASFATATPLGPSPGISGVRVDLSRPAGAPGCRRGTGSAEGDGNFTTDAEPLSGIAFVIGSALADELHGRAGASVDAGLGDDSCSGFTQMTDCGGGDEKPAGAFSYVFAPPTGAPPDPGLIVIGSGGDETIDLTPPAGSLGYVLVYGANGADTVNVGQGFSPDTTIDVNGGPASDTLSGGPLGDVLVGGDFPGADTLNGNGGDDALIGEGGNPATGPDALSGGPGDDQLAADYPCAGDTFSGGPGTDVAGFAPSEVGVRATMGGLATLVDGACPGGSPTRIMADSEVLEGTNEADRLAGSNRPETIWAREGNDAVVGKGGADALEGFAGRDLIDARDGRRDRLIDCGSGRDRARRDRVDPAPIKC
jgi:Ca2+-binding RTX toxin-like protein